MVHSTNQFRLVGPGSPCELQTRVLDSWPDGSVRWCLFDFLATTDEVGYRIEVRPQAASSTPNANQLTAPAEFDVGGFRIGVGTGSALLTARSPEGSLVAEATVSGAILETGKSARSFAPRFQVDYTETGPVRCRVGFTASPLPEGLIAFGYIDLFPTVPVARVRLTIRNTRAAGHPGGNWDLGAKNSVLLRDFSFSVRLRDAASPVVVRCSRERGQPFEQIPPRVEIYQDSSGGEAWQHHTHLNRDRVVPHKFRGYRMTTPDTSVEGPRATPTIILERGNEFVGVTMPYFWENFPKAIEADQHGLSLGLFPSQSEGGHELQGGEQKTHEFFVAFGRDNITEEPLGWCRTPGAAHADPEWYAETGAVPYLTPATTDPHPEYLALAAQAVEGSDTFFAKREVIDEYGWRNFGDVYADHEGVFHTGPEALVSHYNNQYDVVRGCAVQFLRTADPRWWELLIPAADHTCDVDVYHTDQDRAAYNRGLFWCTCHYTDADTSTHRTYPRTIRNPAKATVGGNLSSLGQTGETLRRDAALAVGGGPSASHNYTQGLMLAYFLTGIPAYRDTAVDLAEFVLRIDAPRPLFRLLSGEYSGAATESRDGYHGPGRASGNSILALIVGHQLTGRREYLDKAEQLIRRVSHPWQDLDSMNLLNAELSWFYTMHLQALGQYLDYKASLGELCPMYSFARQTLLHYAKWMAAHERPVLQQPEALQYPTETWAAQDIRKVEVFQFAAMHASGSERQSYLERSEWFFRYVERTLAEFPTRSLCRPVTLLINFGWSRAWWRRHPDATAPAPLNTATQTTYGEQRPFIPQKTRAVRRAKILAVASLAAVLVCLLLALLFVTQH